MTARYFKFESDFVDTLRCIPMCVRHKLDLAGVKLKLNEWSKLAQSEREYIASLHLNSRAEIQTFRNVVVILTRITSGAMPSLMDPVTPDWNSTEIPDQVAEKAVSLGVTVSPEAWRNLGELPRFALMKLSRPGHEGKNFVPALEEFGVTHGGE
jgi:hypothetical protein